MSLEEREKGKVENEDREGGREGQGNRHSAYVMYTYVYLTPQNQGSSLQSSDA